VKVVLLIVLAGLMQAARAFAPTSGLGDSPAATALACGYLMLTGFLAGQLFKTIGLPKLTGYLAAGIVVGPQVLGLVSHEMVENLKIFNGVAIALIALNAGAEMHFRSLRPLFRSITWITLIAVVGTVVLLSVAAFFMRDLLPFMAGLDDAQTLGICVVLGVTTVAQSPAVVVALRDETESDGPMMQTVLAVVIIADLVIILLFAIASTLAKTTFGESADVMSTAGNLAWEILGSGVTGVIVGFLVSIYLKRVKGGGALFIVAVSLVVAEVGRRVHFDPLLVALAAGMFIRNATSVGDRLHHEVDAASVPVYVAFFAVTGAGVHLDALLVVGVPATLFVLVRGLGFYIGNDLAARVARAPEVVRRFGSFGLMPQAGLALALAILFQRNFPDLGPEAAALVFGIVALNELIAPILFRIALIRSGEAGRRQSAPSPAPDSNMPPAPEALATD
jgi:Kef-type K+ transport system membrane component KefB